MRTTPILDWNRAESLNSRPYKCGFCENEVSSARGWHNANSSASDYICSHCHRPTLFEDNQPQVPGPTPGASVTGVPLSIQQLYGEARAAMSAGAYTVAVMGFRKLLMHIAVERGAKEGGTFQQYVSHLLEAGHLGVNSKDWIDHIRTKGNEANHEIVLMSETDASDLLTFSEMLLRILYEFPAKLRPQSPR